MVEKLVFIVGFVVTGILVIRYCSTLFMVITKKVLGVKEEIGVIANEDRMWVSSKISAMLVSLEDGSRKIWVEIPQKISGKLKTGDKIQFFYLKTRPENVFFQKLVK